jgi:cholesterol oxidase
MEPVYDAIVIGSGFGGAINTYRLAHAGKSVLLLERGRRWTPGQFPRDLRKSNEVLWRHPHKWDSRGLYELHVFNPLAVVTASGFGGGSLIYANVHIRPEASVFEDARWPAAITRSSLDPYYARVAKMIGIAPVPSTVPLPKRDVFHRAAAALGRPVFDPDEAVTWDAGAASGRPPCELRTECEFGCQVGAKNSLDHTYLAVAEAAGAEMRTQAVVNSIEPVREGYRVHWRSTTSGERHTATARRVVVAAGTLGTNRLLLMCRDRQRTLPQLSRMLGNGFSANGDFLGSIQNAAFDLDPWRGPDVTSVMQFDQGDVHFTMAAPSFNRPVMEALASAGQPSVHLARPLAPLLWQSLSALLPLLLKTEAARKPARMFKGHGTDPARMTNLFTIGRDNANGHLYLRGGELALEWDYRRENRDLIAAMRRAMARAAAAYGGSFAPIVTWNLFQRILTVHPLGGCRLSTSPERGVVDETGQVHGYPNLFVADGSIVPTAIGFHPCMTIAALAERVAETSAS